MKESENNAKPLSWVRRIGWLLLIWAASVLALGLAAGALRLIMSGIGMAR